MSTKLQWLRECLAGGDVLCHATFWPWIPALRLHGCPFHTVKQPCVYSQLVLRFLTSIFLWLFCQQARQSYKNYMNHHESHPTVSNTLMTPRLRSLWWFLISANLFQPGLLHLHQGLRRFSFEEFSQCLGDGGVDRFDDFEWLQTDAATAFLCVSCHVFSTWIVSTQNI